MLRTFDTWKRVLEQSMVLHWNLEVSSFAGQRRQTLNLSWQLVLLEDWVVWSLTHGSQVRRALRVLLIHLSEIVVLKEKRWDTRAQEVVERWFQLSA